MKHLELITFRVLASRKLIYDKAAEFLKVDKAKTCRDALEEMVKRAKENGFVEPE